MVEKLITDFFKKVEQVEGITTRHGKAKFLVEELLEKKYEKFNYISVQTASRLHKKFVENKKNENVTTNYPFLKDILAEYLSYSSFTNYIDKNYQETEKQNDAKFQEESKDQRTENLDDENSPIEILGITDSPIQEIPNDDNPSENRRKQIIIISLFSLSSIFIINQYFFPYTSNCILWENDRFKYVSCTTENALDNRIYEINVKKFKKADVDKNTKFFDGEIPNYWYGSNSRGEREFFTARGIHPETKKELKPVTRTILNTEGWLNE